MMGDMPPEAELNELFERLLENLGMSDNKSMLKLPPQNKWTMLLQNKKIMRQKNPQLI